VIVGSHIRLDGDAVGSALALAAILNARGARASVVLPDEVPRRYRFLAGADRVRDPSRIGTAKGAVFAVLDVSNPERLGEAARLLESASQTVVIDHHVSNTRFGGVNWVEPGASSVGEMIWRMAMTLAWPVPPTAREALYAAILTDTGRFSFSNSTPEALQAAAALVREGVDPACVAEQVYGGRTPGEWALEVRARASLVVEPGGRVATMALTAGDFAETGTTPVAADDFASFPRTMAGIDVGLFFYEIDGGERTKVGIRTTRAVDANVLAGSFGGGGHARAAGCTIDAPVADARRRVVAEVVRALAGHGDAGQPQKPSPAARAGDPCSDRPTGRRKQ